MIENKKSYFVRTDLRELIQDVDCSVLDVYYSLSGTEEVVNIYYNHRGTAIVPVTGYDLKETAIAVLKSL